MKFRELLKKNKFLYKIGHAINIRKYKKEEKKQNKALHKYGWKICLKVEELLKEYRHSVFFGTLLGFIRDKGFIAHDADIDYAIINDTPEWEDFHNKLKEYGFKFNRAFVVDGKKIEATYSYKGVNIDFFILSGDCELKCNAFYRLSDVAYKYITEYSIKQQTCPVIREFENYLINNVSVKIPKNYNEILNCLYGADWRIPNRNWSDSDVSYILKNVKGYLIQNEKKFLN